jgi:uridine phosphorylase
VLITGMGRANAEDSIRKALRMVQPELVLSCGFAGGLNPKLASETIVFEGGDEGMEATLLSLGAFGVKFHCAERVAVTALEKRALRQSTKADVVEMESAVIGAVCQEAGIPFATVRVILDAAEEDLPLDFNRLMTRKQKLNYFKLTGALLKSPRKIGELKKFQKRCRAAALKLAATLVRIIPG